MQQRARAEQIFIVGMARSGTTLMRKLLETSDEIAIAPETHYAGHYFKRWGARHYFRRLGDLADDATIRRIVEVIYSGRYARSSRWRRVSQYWIWLVKNVERNELEQRLLDGERTERGLFREFLRLYADKAGKPVTGEKTPTHLNQADLLLRWFPNGLVIHMMRDPRAAYVSDRYRRRQSPRRPFNWLAKIPLFLEASLMLQTMLVWRSAVRHHERWAAELGPRYRLVVFEDVVARPDETLGELFGELGVPLPDYNRVDVVAWHGMRSNVTGLDPDAADRWRPMLHPFANRLFLAFLGGAMRRFGYR